MSNIKLFQDKKIRSVWNDEEEQWYFSVVDVVEVLTDSVNPTDYLKKMRKRDESLALYIGTNCPQVEMATESGKKRQYWRKMKDRDLKEYQSYPFWVQLKLASSDGKKYATDCANVKGLLRIIQSIPSPKAEPFKQWLATVGYERMLEIENPELAQERMKELYEQKGYPKDWIDKRLRGIAIRQNLTDEWKRRGITEEHDYAILTAEISKATFGMTPSEYKEFKGLTKKNQNLRDHMNDLELIFTMLGERITTEISEKEKPETFGESRNIARRGGNVAGVARRETEKELGHSVSTPENFLPENQNPKIE